MPAESGGLVVVCAGEAEARAVAGCLPRARRTCFGLYFGWTGRVAGHHCAVVVAGRGENESYVALRQMAYLLRPSFGAAVETVSAVAEGLHGGDFLLIREAARCLVPAGLAQNICEDRYVFPNESVRRYILDAPPISPPDDALMAAMGVLAHDLPSDCVQVEVPAVRAGCAVVSPRHALVRDWLRARFGVQVVAAGTYGFLSAARDLRLPALTAGIVAEGCSDDEEREFRRQRKRYLRAAAMLTLRAAAAAVSRQPQTAYPGPYPSE